MRRLISTITLAAAIMCSLASSHSQDVTDTYRRSDQPADEYTAESQAYYQQAKDLLKEGPSKAPEVIALLKQAIAADDSNADAYYLLGRIYNSTKQFEEALAQFDRALELRESDGKTIVPGMRFYRASTLFKLGRCEEAKQLLESHWAFWQDGGRLQAWYESLHPQVEQECGDVEKP